MIAATMTNSILVYDGPSMLDGERILVFLSGLTSVANPKTGWMVQSYILRASVDPLEANRTGQDVSVCGECPLRGIPSTDTKGTAWQRGCYVRLQHGPLAIWRAWQRGNTPAVNVNIAASLIAGRSLRLGSYGDPAAVPRWVWDKLLVNTVGHTGYSHQAQRDSADFAPDMCMVSVEGLTQAQAAWNKGMRTFRIVHNTMDVDTENEVLCPASAEAGKRTTCENCKLCSGNKIDAKSIAVVAHGAVKFNALRVLQ